MVVETETQLSSLWHCAPVVQVGSQYVSPASWTQRCDPQSLSLRHATQASPPSADELPSSDELPSGDELPSRPPAP